MMISNLPSLRETNTIVVFSSWDQSMLLIVLYHFKSCCSSLLFCSFRRLHLTFSWQFPPEKPPLQPLSTPMPLLIQRHPSPSVCAMMPFQPVWRLSSPPVCIDIIWNPFTTRSGVSLPEPGEYLPGRGVVQQTKLESTPAIEKYTIP